ncbi:MAG: DNA cytosine methyltransferase, partial [Candidatus Omnitrophica bacterium]|nr:DNA cytosine methyltransferase [Candidatus Omnitrophota bacterium]
VRIRRLTPRECFRLQGFSDDLFDKAASVNSDAQLYKQAGNGVTVNVVYSIGRKIADMT